MASTEIIDTSPSPFSFVPCSKIILRPPSQALPSQRPRKPLNFSFPIFPVAGKSDSAPMAFDSLSSCSPLDSRQRETPDQCTFTNIPAEIRLHIYHYVLLSHPVRHAHLASDYESLSPSEGSRRPQITVHSEPPNLTPLGRSIPSQPILSPRSLDGCPKGISPSKIPFGLLASCRQIYEETRLLPFRSSDFSFINWHNDGIYAARHFSRSLREWQSDALRHVNLESREYHLRGRHLEEWKELISLWCGVRTLRLCVQSSSNGRAKSIAVLEPRLDLESRHDAYRRSQEASLGVSGVVGEVVDSVEFFSVKSRWVKEGLLNLNSLRCLELQIEDESIDRGFKLGFCSALEGLFNSKIRKRDDGWDREVKVVLIEKPKVEEKEKVENSASSFPQDIQHANDAIWGLEV